MDKLVFEKDTKLVEIKHFIYPFYVEEIERELREHGITELYSYGNVKIGNVYVIGKGKTGIIALLDKDKVIKIRRSDSPKESLEIEAKIQSFAYPIAPKVYDYGRNFIVMEYIKGRHLSKNEKVEIIKDLIMKAWELENKKIEHKELSRPYKNVIVTSERTYIIDYDSASIKENPNNVTSVLSWFGYIKLAKEYKRNRRIDEVLKMI